MSIAAFPSLTLNQVLGRFGSGMPLRGGESLSIWRMSGLVKPRIMCWPAGRARKIWTSSRATGLNALAVRSIFCRRCTSLETGNVTEEELNSKCLADLKKHQLHQLWGDVKVFLRQEDITVGCGLKIPEEERRC